MSNTVSFYGKKVANPIKKDQIGTIDKKRYGLSFPTGSLNNKGFFAKISGTQLSKANLKQLVLTARGERVMLPNFGTNLRNYLFEQLDAQTVSNIKKEIMYSFAKYGQGLKLLKMQVLPNDSVNYQGTQGITVRLFVEVENNDQIIDVEVSLG